MKTTLGQLMVNIGLPKELRNYSRQLNKDSVKELLSEVQRRYPEKYSQVLHHLTTIGRNVAYNAGESFSIDDLLETEARERYVKPLQHRVEAIQADPRLSPEQKEERTMEEMLKVINVLEDSVYKEALRKKNNFAEQVKSGARGKPANLLKLLGSEVAVSDYRGRPIMMPIINNFSTGLDPAEFWATSYGVRSGYAKTKFLTAEAGFLAKELANAAHRLVVTKPEPKQMKYPIGLPVEADDPDNEGAVLAAPAGGYRTGTVLTPEVIANLKKKMGSKRILIHSPLTSMVDDDGIDALSAGYRTRGTLANVGDNVGIEASQALTERISQTSVGSKHGAGVLGTKGKKEGPELSGFDFFNRLVEAPKHFPEAGPLAAADGVVGKIEEAPHGGYYVYVSNNEHYIPAGHKVTVKQGQKVEAGDLLSDGIPHPHELVKYKGVGEARRIMTKMLYDAAKKSGWGPHRRNVEVLSRALIDRVKITSPKGFGDNMPDDITPYSRMAVNYRPRKGTQTYKTKQAKGKYLESPVLHYSIGTRVTPSVINTLKEFNVGEVDAHPEPPEFEPVFIRAMDQLGTDPDWMTTLGGFYLGRHFMTKVHRGAKSEPHSTSWMPALAEGKEFGKKLQTGGKY